MLVKCLKEDLAAALQTVQKGAAIQTTLEILSGIMFKAEKDKLELYATNLEISVITSINAQVEKEGRTVVPAKLVADIVKNLPSGQVELGLDPTEENTFKVTAANSDFKIRSLMPEDFPDPPTIKEDKKLTLKSGDLQEGLRQTLKAVSRDETRPILNGVLFYFEKNNLKVVATDSYRLAVRDIPLSKNIDEKTEVVVPWRALDELQKTLPATNQETEIVLTDNQIVFRTAATTLISRLIEGQFPNYQQLLPDNYKFTTAINREDLTSAVTRAALVAQKNQSIKLRLNSDRLLVSSQAQGVGEAQEEIKLTSKSDEDIEIAFNAQYLLDGLTGVKDENIAIGLNDALSPGLLSRETSKDYLYLIMPIRIGS